VTATHRAAAHRLLAEAFHAVEQAEQQPSAASDAHARGAPSSVVAPSDHGPIAASAGLQQTEHSRCTATRRKPAGASGRSPRRIRRIGAPRSTLATCGA
jgi:hypothetical protein